VTRSGALFCWGENASGRLGDGTSTNRSGPVRIQIPGLVRRVSIGASVTCAVDAQGAFCCWGERAFGPLGDGRFKHDTTRGRLPYLEPNGERLHPGLHAPVGLDHGPGHLPHQAGPSIASTVGAGPG